MKENIFWTGGIDWDIRNFHGYSTPFGIIDDKPTVIDTVKKYCADEMIRRISENIDPSKIEYIISNHTEMEKSNTLSLIILKWTTRALSKNCLNIVRTRKLSVHQKERKS